MENFDLLIVNKGISGLALACGLNNYFRILIIEQNMNLDFFVKNQSNINVSWINIASVKILQYLNVWDQNIVNFSTFLYSLEIFKKDDIRKLIFDSGYLGYPKIGYIVNYYIIYQALIKRVQELKNITFIDTTLLKKINYCEDKVFITLNNGYVCSTKLLIGADGINSWIRHYSDISLIFRDIKNYGLISVIYSEKPHKNTFRCIIRDNDILLLLPLINTHLSVIFWLLPSHIAKKNTCISDYILFCHYNLINIPSILGNCVLYDDKMIDMIPLRIQYAHRFIQHRLVLLGKSAYSISPLPFQDANLELADAAELLHYLKKLKKNNQDIGYNLYLKPYERKIKYKMNKNTMSIPYIHAVYCDNNRWLTYIYYMVLYLTKITPNLKPHILHHIMGLNDIPVWLLQDYYD